MSEELQEDLVEKVEWALDNDERAEAIALAGVDFVRRRLTLERVNPLEVAVQVGSGMSGTSSTWVQRDLKR